MIEPQANCSQIANMFNYGNIQYPSSDLEQVGVQPQFLEHFSLSVFSFIYFFSRYISLRESHVHLFHQCSAEPLFQHLADRHFKTDGLCQISDLSVSGQSPQAPKQPFLVTFITVSKRAEGVRRKHNQLGGA